jgi:hypothetical protein
VEREQIDLAISELETRLDRLRALYEHYFMGIERIEPSVPRKDVERRVADLRKARFQSTAQRFKFQTIVQRYNTMQQHWSRICREIELGTFRRHRLKAEQAFGSRPPVPRAPVEVAAPEVQVPIRAPADSISDADFPPVELGTGAAFIPSQAAERPEGTPAGGMLRRLQQGTGPTLGKGLLGSPPLPSLPTPGPALPPRPRPAPVVESKEEKPAPPVAVAGLSEARVRALHQAYIDARKRTNASSVSFEKLERSLRETETKLRSTHQGRTVDFDVVIRDGKAILKPKLT